MGTTSCNTAPYYGKPNNAYPAGHPFNCAVHFAFGYVSRALLPESSPLRQLFEADDLLAFLRALLPNERLHGGGKCLCTSAMSNVRRFP